jgi:general secretion pathway protein K
MLVIWSLVMLASIATGFAYAVRHETRYAGDLASIARAEAASEAALRIAVLALGSSDQDARWPADGRKHDIPWPDATVSVRVYSESGRIDLNRAPRELLIGLFQQLLPDADAETLADTLIDWRDANDQPLADGAELADYARAGYSYGPTNRPFDSVHELSQVMGFDRDAVEALVPHLTVYSRRARIDATGADPIVLAAIPGISLAEAETFVAYRDAALAAGEEVNYKELGNAGRYLDTRGRHYLFSLDSDISLADGTNLREHSVVEIRPGRHYRVLAREALAAATITEDLSE